MTHLAHATPRTCEPMMPYLAHATPRTCEPIVTIGGRP